MSTGPVGSVFRENSFYGKNLVYKMREGCHVAKRSSDPRQAYPEVKLLGRDLVRVVGIVAPLPHWGPVPGENSFYRARGAGGGNGPMKRLQGAPSSGTPRESQTNFKGGTLWGL